MPKKIISGGQTGIDRGALDACLFYDFPCGGWCPAGRQAEDGIINLKYPLRETESEDYETRTRLNVNDSDGTLIISPGFLFGGTFLTKQITDELDKPLFIFSPWDDEFAQRAGKIAEWIEKYNIEILNIAGPRASQWLTSYEISFFVTETLIASAPK